MTHFWIPIDKKYIDENLDSLMAFLREEDVDASLKKKTIKALQERSAEILNEVQVSPMGIPSELSVDELIIRIRIISYCILIEKTSNVPLVVLLAYLLESSSLTTSKQKKELAQFVITLLSGSLIEKLGFSWNDLPNTYLAVSVFASKLVATKLSKTMRTGYIEQKGCLTVSGGSVALVASNKADYDKACKSGNLETLFDLYNLRVMIPKGEIPSNLDQFRYLLEPVHNFFVEQNSIKPSPILLVEKLKTYKVDDAVTIKLLNVQNGYMNSVSVDPGYETINGSFFYTNNFVPGYQLSMMSSRAKILLEQGNIIYVRVSKQSHPVTPFIVDYEFEGFYYDSAENFRDDETVCLAKAIEFKGLGNIWLTEQGFSVYVKDTKYQDKTGTFAKIKITDVDFDDATIYGEVVEDNYEYAESADVKFETSARWRMLDEFLLSGERPTNDNCQQETSFSISASEVNLLSKMFFDLSKYSNGSLEVFKHLVLSRMLSALIEQKENSDYVKFQMDYLKAVVGFSSNPNYVIPDIYIPQGLKENEEILQKIDILNALREYDTYLKTPETDFSRLSSDNNNLVQIRDLVKASNLLNGIIPDTGLDPIKRLLAYNLGVEEDYTSIISEKTDYGSELTGREFKSSIVYPPNNNMKPDLSNVKKITWSF